MKKVAIVALAVLGVGSLIPILAQSSDTGAIPYENLTSVNNGRGIYLEQCASCHGTQLEGAKNWRDPDEDGMAQAPPHDESGHTWHHPDMTLFRITKFGTAKILSLIHI